MVVPLVNVHWFRPNPNGVMFGGDGRKYEIACKPNVKVMHQLGRYPSASGQVDAVTCEACKNHPEFAAEMSKHLYGEI